MFFGLTVAICSWLLSFSNTTFRFTCLYGIHRSIIIDGGFGGNLGSLSTITRLKIFNFKFDYFLKKFNSNYPKT